MRGKTEQRREVELPRGQIGGAADIADTSVDDDLEAVDARLAVLNPHDAVEGLDRRLPA